jgi:L-iditol 2-dehydrogenase
MKAVRLYAAKDLRVEEVEKPRISENEILMRVRAATICASDIRSYNYGDGRMRPPRILGHEIAGDIEEVGSNVKGYDSGMRATLNPNIFCGRCVFCVTGRHELCDERRALGFDVDGGFAEYVLIPPESVRTGVICEIPDNVSYEEAALIEPISCCLHAQTLVKVGAGDTVTVIGAGPMGIMHTVMAKALGASRVIVSEISEQRLQTAAHFGADVLVNPTKEDLASRVFEATGRDGSDVVIVAVGSRSAMEQALRLLSKGGRVCFFAGSQKGRESVRINANIIHYMETVVTGAFASTPYEFHQTVRLAASGRLLNMKPIVTHRFRLQDASKAFEAALSGKALKVCLNPEAPSV